MSIESHSDTKIGEGRITCPSCKSDAWKSAKMIVLEGTTVSGGKIDGQVVDPGRFSGGIRDFLLADRWFTWGKKFDAEFEMTTTSALVLAIRNLMLAQGSMLQMPREPVAPPIPPTTTPPKIGWLEQIQPSKPTCPTKRETREPPPDRPWYSHFWSYVKAIVVLCIGAVAVVMWMEFFYLPAKNLEIDYERTLQLGLAMLVLVFGSALVRSFGANRRARAQVEQVNSLIVAANQRAQDKYEKNLAKYQSDLVAAADQQRRQERRLAAYDRQREQELKNYDQREAEYKQQLVEYEKRKQTVLVARELVWERARVCMRCGTAYQATTRNT